MIYRDKKGYRIYKKGKYVTSYSYINFKKYAKRFAELTDKTDIIYKNIIFEKKDYYKMIIYSKKFGKCDVLFDKDDINFVIRYRWYVTGNNSKNSKPYCRAEDNLNNKTLKMHKEFCKGIGIVDHKNRDTLDNRRKNLRLISKKENNYNKSKYINNTSGITGVYERKNSWDCIVFDKNGKRHMKSFSKNKYKDAKERAIKYRKNNTKHYKRKNIIHIIHKI